MHDNEANWEKFRTGRTGPRKSYMHISINKRGKIQLNTFLMQELKFPKAVALYYNHAKSLIGIKPIDPADEDALPVNLRSRRRYGEVYALSFLQYYRIKITNTLATHYLDTDANGMLILDLRKTQEISRKSRRANTASP